MSEKTLPRCADHSPNINAEITMDRQKEEIAFLSNQQTELRRKSIYLTMTREESAEYDIRRRKILELTEQLLRNGNKH